MSVSGRAPRRPVFRRRRPRRGRALGWLVAVVAIAASVWLIGLAWFVESLPRSVDDKETVTDGIVVLTGGAERIEAGIALLIDRKADKLLLSGAGRGWHRDGIEAMSGELPELFACCVVVDYDAQDTVGNAAETARWALAEGYGSLRVVTANYHMPRSMVEFGRAMSDVRLIAHPVASPNVRLKDWWSWPGTASLLAREYSKYLVSLARAGVLSLLPGGEPA